MLKSGDPENILITRPRVCVAFPPTVKYSGRGVAAWVEGRNQESIQLILVDVLTLWTVKRPSEAQTIDSVS
jgi:hypothetical protein